MSGKTPPFNRSGIRTNIPETQIKEMRRSKSHISRELAAPASTLTDPKTHLGVVKGTFEAIIASGDV